MNKSTGGNDHLTSTYDYDTTTFDKDSLGDFSDDGYNSLDGGESYLDEWKPSVDKSADMIEDDPDAVVLQTGSIEITNIDVKKALMDPFKSIEQYKQEWTDKVKDDSNNLFKVLYTVC